MRYKVFLMVFIAYVQLADAQQPAASGTLDDNAIKTLFFAGLRDKLNEDYSKANESFNKILSLDPNNAAVYYEMATLNYRQNKLADAELAAKKATSLDGNNLWYWKLLAELYKRKGDMESLIGVFDQLIRLSPETDSYYFDRSNACLLAGKTEEALKGYDILERKFGASAALTQARQRISLGTGKSTGQRDVEKLLTADLGDVKNHLSMSSVLMDKGQPAASLAILKKAKLLEPESYEVDLAMADAYKELKNKVAAVTALKTAFANTAMPMEQKVKIIMMLLGTKGMELSNASELAEIAVKVHPGDPNILTVYGDVLYEQGDLNRALDQFRVALKLTDQIYRAWERALVIEIDLKQYKEAIKTADAALNIYPNQAILYYNMALALQYDNQYGPALSNVKTALQLDVDNGTYLELYGDILLLNGDKTSALQQWKKAKAAGNGSERLNRKINENR